MPPGCVIQGEDGVVEWVGGGGGGVGDCGYVVVSALGTSRKGTVCFHDDGDVGLVKGCKLICRLEGAESESGGQLGGGTPTNS